MNCTQIVHWPSGPVNTCDRHARELIGLGKFLGSHVVATPLANGDPAAEVECQNCVSEQSSAE